MGKTYQEILAEIAELERLAEDAMKPPRFPEPVRSRGWGIVSHGIRQAEPGPMIRGADGGCSGAASQSSCP